MTEEQIKQKAEEKAYNETENWNYKFSDEIEYKVKQIWLDGYHECQKEHEWHYVKDGDLPKEKCLAVVLLDTGSIQSYLVKEITEEEMKNGCDIIKWKEIE